MVSKMLGKYSLYFAWLIACLGTLGSLYFSEIRHLEPCHLCWYQRIALFPLPLFLGIATYTHDKRIALYTLPLVSIGFIFALYQVLIQHIPGWYPIEMCGAGPNCAEKLDIGLGFITLPILSACNFFLLAVLLFYSLKHTKTQSENVKI
jgi:disulfide bond formation protein DsbB